MAVAFAAVTVALTYGLVATGVIYVESGSTLATLLGSGTFSGLLTLLTVALSVNQLVLSRVFGSPSGLSDRLQGTLDLRRTVEDLAGVPRSPNEPGAFLALVGATLERRATEFGRRTSETESLREFGEYAGRIADYGSHLDSADERESTVDVLLLTLGSTYAEYLAETREVSARYGDDLPSEAAADLDDIQELLESVAVVRQFLKTLAMQQDLASLSRQLIFTGLAAVLTTYYLTQVYTNPSSLPTTLPAAWLPVVTSVASGVILLPLYVLLTHLLRVATIARYTVSVGPFVPPEERFGRP